MGLQLGAAERSFFGVGDVDSDFMSSFLEELLLSLTICVTDEIDLARFDLLLNEVD